MQSGKLLILGTALTLPLLSLDLAQAQLPAKVGDTPVPSLAPMIKKVSPAVVNIAVEVNVTTQRNPLFDDPFFRRYFDIPEQGPRRRHAQAAGSGVIVDAKNGYVITNAHVIENASTVNVTLLDDRVIKAEIVGRDKGSDLAVLKIKATNLVDMPFADSSKTEVGDFVVAIGNPFGLQHTVTSGIVSGLGRANINPDSREAYEDFIQTDAAINPGNSGGALVNLGGELVGVNSAILSGSGGNIGIGFAIPSNMTKAIMDQLVKSGVVKRGRLGVSISRLSPEIAASLGLRNGTSGAMVSQVLDDSPAEKAGVKAGDIITSVNGKNIRSDSELRNTIAMSRIGEKVQLGLFRDGKAIQLAAVVGETEAAVADSDSDDSGGSTEQHEEFQGAEFADAANSGGVLVQSVAPRSPAAARLRPNDIIVAVSRTRVTNLAQFRAAIKDAPAFTLTIRRGTSTVVVAID